MTIERIIQIADAAYGGENLISNYFHKPEENHGDSLAKFIAEELESTYKFDASDEDQCIEVGLVMANAANSLLDIGDRFYKVAGGKDEY